MAKIKKMEMYRIVAENLNRKGVMPFSAREWQAHNVQSFVSRGLKDPVIVAEINQVSKQLNQSNNGE
jgi:hypothetical protein